MNRQQENSVSWVSRRPNDKNWSVGVNCYKGCLHTVSFTVNRPIELLALEFFGPAKGDAAYLPRVQVSRTVEDWNDCTRMFGWLIGGPYYKIEELLPLYEYDTKIDAKWAENFMVPLPTPVLVSPNEWTDIKFELVGPKTFCLKYGFGGIGYNGKTEDNSDVQFQFTAGSCQLPRLCYRAVPLYKI